MKNYFIINNEQNINHTEQSAQLYGSGVILLVEPHILCTEYPTTEIQTVSVRNWFGYENQTYSDLNIENDLKNTGLIYFSNSLPNFTYAVSINRDTYNEKEICFCLRDVLQNQGHFAKVILWDDFL